MGFGVFGWVREIVCVKEREGKKGREMACHAAQPAEGPKTSLIKDSPVAVAPPHAASLFWLEEIHAEPVRRTGKSMRCD